MNKLADYHSKRQLDKSGEPAASEPESDHSVFVVQKHDASRLHYDFRLQLDGVLKSWAVPKGPSLDPGEKRLAVHVEDHPLDYADFEGIIPQGEYGGGTVMVWDRGTYQTQGDAEESYRRGEWKIELAGEKMRGRWVLVRMKKQFGQSPGETDKNWLFIKERDANARSDKSHTWLEDNANSVKSGRSMQAIAADGSDQTPQEDPLPQKVISALAHSQKAPLPVKISPQLATLANAPPAGDQWFHEIKFDGYRLLVRIDHGQVKLFTRQGHDWTDRFPVLADQCAHLPCRDAVLEGEAVVLDEQGVSQFQRLQNAMKNRRSADGKEAVQLFAFDLLHIDGYSLMRCELADRKRLLAQWLASANTPSAIHYCDHIVGSGPAFYEQACERHLEGIISKRPDAVYCSGRTRTWIKTKCIHQQEFIIVGYTSPGGSRTGFGALLLGSHDDAGRLIYCGRVGTGFDETMLSDLAGKLRQRSRKTSPLDRAPPRREQRDARWVRADLVAEVRFSQWTDDNLLRHAVFLGLREDKSPAEVTRERAAGPT